MAFTCYSDCLGEGRFEDYIIYLTSLAKHSTVIKDKLPELDFLFSGALLIILGISPIAPLSVQYVTTIEGINYFFKCVRSRSVDKVTLFDDTVIKQ